MVKVLRNRQILDQDDLVIDNGEPTYPITAKLSKSMLKRAISKKLENKQKDHAPKHSRFIENIQNGSITAVADETKFQCPICLELMVRPTLMSCGHMYCYRCVESNIAHNATCCLCRQQQNPNNFIHSSFTQNLINEILAPRSSEIFKYLCRTIDTKEWVNRREVKNLKAGLIVDFQDAFKVWRRAIILQTFLRKNGQLMVKIKTFFKGTQILETIEASSRRLAPLNFFTRAKYLEDFTPSLPQYDTSEKELQILEYRHCKSLEEDVPLGSLHQECFPQYQHIQHQQLSQNFQDQALALFNWQMNVADFLF